MTKRDNSTEKIKQNKSIENVTENKTEKFLTFQGNITDN